MKRNKDKLIAIILLLVFLGCNESKMEERKSSEKQLVGNYINNWIKDTQGCLKLRSRELADSLIRAHNLESKSIDEFKLVLGLPNEVEVIDKQNILIYYFDCACKDSLILENSDKCYAKFYFENGRNTSRVFICE